jgi:hypothetical protein
MMQLKQAKEDPPVPPVSCSVHARKRDSVLAQSCSCHVMSFGLGREGVPGGGRWAGQRGARGEGATTDGAAGLRALAAVHLQLQHWIWHKGSKRARGKEGQQ